jgi:hypothetical protein
MGVGLGSKSLDFSYKDRVDGQIAEDIDLDEEINSQVEFRAATVVDAEGAYFFNKYVGVGGRLRVRAMSAKTFGQYAESVQVQDWDAWGGLAEAYYQRFPNDYTGEPVSDALTYLEKIGLFDFHNFETPADAPVTDIYGVVKSDHLAEFTGSLGLYFNLPLSKRFALGAKALIGRSFTQKLDIDGYAKGNIMDIDYSLTVKNGDLVDHTIQMPQKTSNTYEVEWDYVTLGADNTTTWGTGLSLTYKYKSNFSWRIFADYDYSEKTFTLTYDPYHFIQYGLTGSAYTLAELTDIGPELYPLEYKKSKKMNYVTLGLSFLVNI